MDRRIITGMVEDYWRSVLPVMQSKNIAAAAEIMKNFDRRVSDTAKTMSPLEAAAFQTTVEAERERLLAEYRTNPSGLKRRLNISLGVDAKLARSRSRNGLGELAVRTVVRASVWEVIWTLFRSRR